MSEHDSKEDNRPSITQNLFKPDFDGRSLRVAAQLADHEAYDGDNAFFGLPE
jgi:hypothetical protein